MKHASQYTIVFVWTFALMTLVVGCSPSSGQEGEGEPADATGDTEAALDTTPGDTEESEDGTQTEGETGVDADDEDVTQDDGGTDGGQSVSSCIDINECASSCIEDELDANDSCDAACEQSCVDQCKSKAPDSVATDYQSWLDCVEPKCPNGRASCVCPQCGTETDQCNFTFCEGVPDIDETVNSCRDLLVCRANCSGDLCGVACVEKASQDDRQAWFDYLACVAQNNCVDSDNFGACVCDNCKSEASNCTSDLVPDQCSS